jgi:hypothetical protein
VLFSKERQTSGQKKLNKKTPEKKIQRKVFMKN